MFVLPPTPLAPALPGIAHHTRASRANGLTQLSVWHQTLEPGAGTPHHRHDCDEIVLCIGGSGEVVSNGGTERFSAGSTLIFPADLYHTITNTGSSALEIIGVLAATPVVTRDESGTALPLPWAS